MSNNAESTTEELAQAKPFAERRFPSWPQASSAFASAGLRVTVYADANATGDVHVDLANSAGGRVEFECAIDGASRPCLRIVDTGGPNAGTWTVTGVLANADRHGFAGATMSVDFLTS